MIATRRQALAGLAASGLATVAGRAAARESQITPPVLLDDARLTQGGWARGHAMPAVLRLTLDGAPVPVDAQGQFFIAFDRDAAPAATLSAQLANGNAWSLPLTIAPRQWDVQTVNAPFHPPGLPDADFARIRAGELAQIAAARAATSNADGWRQAFAWPAKGRISGLFGAQRVFRDPDGQTHPAAYHPGLDIALPQGTPYAAPADGVVMLAAADVPFTLEGHLLMIDHGMGLGSAFLHSSALLVKVGDRVVQGQPLGEVGMTGRATGPHLHWAIKWRAARLDPLLFVGAMG
jgi:murein DD-endopeptidase MepM/ murein hydrolase activator NlpD